MPFNHPNLKDITGKVFGRLTALKRIGTGHDRHAIWLCRCSCGKRVEVSGVRMRKGHTQSCGCLKIEVTVRRSTKHGHGRADNHTPTYSTWSAMRARCSNPRNRAWKYYGGRGIKVCERWDTFENFLADMGEKPPGLTIDRRDNNQNYEPGNCRWATQKEQGRNSRHNRVIRHNGETRCLSEWGEVTGIKRATIWGRMRRGWPDGRLLEVVPRNGRCRPRPKGVTK